MKALTPQQIATLIAFLDAFDLTTTGAWAGIEACMRDDFEIANPEAALEDARAALASI